MPMDFKTTQWIEYLQLLAATSCDLYTEVPGIYGHAQFHHLTWSRWIDSIKNHMKFPDRAAGLNPTVNGAWISYMLENAQRKENIRRPDPNVASTGDRAGDGWTGPVIEEVIEGQAPSYLPPTPSETWPSPPFVKTAQEIRDQTKLLAIGDSLFKIAMTSRKYYHLDDVLKGYRPRAWRRAAIYTSPGGTAKEALDILRTHLTMVPDTEYIRVPGSDQKRLKEDHVCLICLNLNEAFRQGRRGEIDDWSDWEALLDIISERYQRAMVVCTASAEYWGIWGESAKIFDATIKMLHAKRRERRVFVWSGEAFFREIEPFKLCKIYDLAQRLLGLDAWHFGECRAAKLINCLPRSFDKMFVQAIFFLNGFVLSIGYCMLSRLGELRLTMSSGASTSPTGTWSLTLMTSCEGPCFKT